MTIKTWHKYVLKTCKNCDCLMDIGITRPNYRCTKYDMHPYGAVLCKKFPEVKNGKIVKK